MPISHTNLTVIKIFNKFRKSNIASYNGNLLGSLIVKVEDMFVGTTEQ
jgi:hypothetical protein